MAQEQSIKISLEAYQELVLRKIDSDVPITKQIDKLLGIKNGKLIGKKSNGKGNKVHA